MFILTLLLLFHVQDHSYSIDSITELKRKLCTAERRVEELTRKNKNLEAREKRAKLMCKSLISQLKAKSFLTAEMEQNLQVVILR